MWYISKKAEGRNSSTQEVYKKMPKKKEKREQENQKSKLLRELNKQLFK
jgi:hypothetical protein